jgi:hypothetical protein
MEQVPTSGAVPDIASSNPFHVEENVEIKLLYFRNIKPLSARQGGAIFMSYPYVLAVLEVSSQNVVAYVTAEKSIIGTACLCIFANNGMHYNLGSWNLTSSMTDFVRRARVAIGDKFDLPEPKVIPKKWFGIF